MGATVLLAVTAFVVLTGSAEASRLETTSTVATSFRPPYDILVRPAGSQTAVERDTGRVRPNYLSGIFGGITLAQTAKIKAMAGVSVAAPIAMLGEVLETVDYPVDVTRLVGQSGRALLRFRTTEHTMRGLGTVPGPSGYLYVADSPVIRDLSGDVPVTERVRGRRVPVCHNLDPSSGVTSPFAPLSTWSAQCWDRLGGLAGERWPQVKGRYDIAVRLSFPVMVAAVDPRAEATLTGLRKAIVGGNYLRTGDKPTQVGGSSGNVVVPVLASSRSIVDQHTTVHIDRLGKSAVAALRSGPSFTKGHRLIMQASGRRVSTVEVDEQHVHQEWLAGGQNTQSGTIYPRLLFITSPVTYQGQSGAELIPRTRRNDPSIWRTSLYSNEPFAAAPQTASDTAYRTITPVPAKTDEGTGAFRQLELDTVGQFDPAKVSSGAPLAAVPLETYHPPSATPADARTRKLLGGRSLLPDTNPGGYLQAPPTLLTTLSSIRAFTGGFAYPAGSPVPRAPISVVRLRVAGVTGADAVSRERIRLVAEQIRKTTGLDVDIMAGSSPHPTDVVLPATAHGAPRLTVSEKWVDKGVATVLISAIDRKSLALFLLILLTSAVAVAISATAAVRGRRTQLGVLSCVGWRPWILVRSVLAELLAVGLLAGTLGALIAAPVGALLGAHVTLWRTLAAIPGGILIVLVAGVVPAIGAARAVPADAVRPVVSTTSRPTRLRGPASLARSYLRRTPGRACAAGLALALAVCSLTILAGIVFGFHDAVVGSLLGNAVSVEVRGVDIAAAALLAVLGLGSLTDILYLDIREQAPRYASLQASGWRDRTLGALIVYQALMIATLGALVGGATGMAALAALAPINATVWVTTALIALAAVAAAGVLALLPARSLRTLPTAELLAQE